MFDHLKKTKFTLYTPIGNTYKKTILEDCVKRQSLELALRSQGTFSFNVLKIFILDISKYNENDTLEDDFWSIKVGSDKNFTYIVEGECAYDFPVNPDNQTLSEALRLFDKNYNYKKALYIKNNIHGLGAVDHIEVIC